MFDIIGIITRTWLAASSPAPAQQHIVSIPLAAAPGASAAAGSASGSAASQPDAAATAKSASDIVNEVQKFYAGIKQVTASFRQSVTNKEFGQTKNSDGTLWLMKPGKMRWDYLGKKAGKVEVKKSFISNGSYLYVVEHDNKQIMKKNLQNDLMPVAVSFLYGKGDLQAEFTAELDKTGKYGDKGDLVLKMTPKKASAQYKNLFLVVAPDNFRVKQSIIVDSSGNVNHFKFYKPDFEKALKPSIFEFDERSLKNYRIIDGDAPPPNQGSAAGSAAPMAPPPAPATK